MKTLSTINLPSKPLLTTLLDFLLLGSCLSAPLLIALSIALSTALYSPASFGLPDDQDQDAFSEALSSVLDINTGITTLYGTEEEPAVVTQGSIVIRGIQITIEKNDDGIHQIIATGSPALFQQQPEIDESIIYVTGLNILFDNTLQRIDIDGEAEFKQDRNNLKAHHIDYDIEAKIANATSNGDRVKTVITPSLTE